MYLETSVSWISKQPLKIPHSKKINSSVGLLSNSSTLSSYYPSDDSDILGFIEDDYRDNDDKRDGHDSDEEEDEDAEDDDDDGRTGGSYEPLDHEESISST